MKQPNVHDRPKADEAEDKSINYELLLEKFNKTAALCKELDKIIECAPDGIYITDG